MSAIDYYPERLDAMLTRPKPTAVRERLDNLPVAAACGELNRREALAFLCAAEIAHHDQRRIRMGLSIAKLPFVRTLEGFDYGAQPAVDAAQMRELAPRRWIANDDALLLLGPPGLGMHAGMSQLVEEISNGGSGLSSLGKMLNLDDSEFWKGALIGAAAVLLLTNELVQSMIFKTGVKAKEALRSGVEMTKAAARPSRPRS